MPALSSVGVFAAILRRTGGVDLDLLESREGHTGIGSGITTQSNARRTLARPGAGVEVLCDSLFAHDRDADRVFAAVGQPA